MAPGSRSAEAGPVLQGWLGETPLADFLSRQLGREPLARPGAAGVTRPLFGWETLDRLLGRPDLDILVVRNGRESPSPPPRDRAGRERLLGSGWGVVIRRAERQDPGLAGLARRFADELPGQVHVQLFATPGGGQGFGWHYDAEEVFIVQTWGEKDYFFRRNTIDPEPVPGAQPDFARIRGETTPIMTCSLWPGDWLYLPRGWWHVAKARSDSLSISLGVLPHAAPSSGA